MSNQEVERLLRALAVRPHDKLLTLIRHVSLPGARALSWGRRLWPHRPPAFAWSAPSQKGRGSEELYAILPFATASLEGRSVADAQRRHHACQRATLRWGPRPPGGWGRWPTTTVAWPFDARLRARPPFGRQDGALRTYRLLLATLASGETGAIWREPLPHACRAWRARGAPLPPPAAVVAEVTHLVGRARALGTRLRAGTPAPLRRPSRLPAARPPPPVPSAIDRAVFCRRVRAVVAACRAGGLHKLVIARAVRLDAPPQQAFDAWRAFAALVDERPTARCFYLGLKNQRAFVGASPETLWRQEAGHYFTHALAGTVAGGGREAAKRRLLGSAKDRAEHAIVVEAIAGALGSSGMQVPAARQPQVVAAGSLWHLETRLQGRCAAGTDAFFALAQLHPTPALGGSPPGPARQWLAEQEPWRGLYGGAVGWLSEADSHLAVAIRSAVVTPAWACVFAGAGIVAASEPAAEWRETQAKLAALRASVQRSAALRRAGL